MFMKSYVPQTYALMRFVTGLLFIAHGTQKLFGFPLPAMEGIPLFVTYIAGPIELVGGVLIAIGWLTRLTAFLSSGLMAAGYWMVHGTKALIPLVNGGELAALYCFIFLFIAAYGPGRFSVDGLLRKSETS